MPTYARNKQAYFNYDILEEIEAGLVLSGQEVKSIRDGQVNLKGSYIVFDNGEAYLKHAHISKYRFASIEHYDPTRPRKLLLRHNEINRLIGKTSEKGLTIIPLSVYTKGRHIKIKIGVARGKKKHDKRESIKKRDIARDVQREVKDLM